LRRRAPEPPVGGGGGSGARSRGAGAQCLLEFRSALAVVVSYVRGSMLRLP